MIWKTDWKRFHKHFLLVLACVIQLACGGGGGGDDAATSQIPAPDNPSTPDPNNVIPTRHLVEISYFGEGSLVIEGDQGNIRCESRGLCAGRVESGSTITVEAMAAPGHEFDGWQNCDSTTGDRCSVAINKNMLITTAFPSQVPLKYQDDVIFLTASEIDSIASYDPDTGMLIFGASADISRLAKGTLIISNGTPDNFDSGKDFTFSRRIENVVALQGSSAIFQTAPVSFGDIVAEGTFVHKSTLDANQLGQALPEGFSIRSSEQRSNQINIPPLEISKVISDEDGDYSTKNDQVEVTGQLDLALSVEAYVAERLGYFTPEVRVIFHQKLKSSLSATYGKEAKLADDKVLLGSFYDPLSQPRTIISIYLAFELTASGEIEPIAEMVSNSVLGWHYIPGEPDRGIGSHDEDYNLDVELKAEAKGKFGIKLEPTLEILWVVEAGVGAFPHVGLEIAAIVSQDNLNDTRCRIEPAFFFGIEAYATGQFKFFGKSPITITLLSYEAPIEIEGLSNLCSFPDYSPPLPPENLYLSRKEADRIQFGWSAAEDEGGIASYSIYRDDRVLVEDVPGYHFLDAGLSSGVEYCYDVVAIDNAGNKSDRSEPPLCVTTLQRDNTPPTNPDNVSVSPLTASSILITWEEANDNTSVESYLISKASANSPNSYVIGESQGSELRVTGLSSDTEYCYFVSAVDLFGNVSLPSRTVCGRTHGAQYANWVMRSACIGSNYLFEKVLDIDESASSTISFIKTWSDYDGKTLGGAFNGSYDISTSVLRGELLYSAEGSGYTRRDDFSVSLASGDTGDIPTTTAWIGPDGSSLTCDTVVRFTRSDQSRQIQQAMHGQRDANALNALP